MHNPSSRRSSRRRAILVGRATRRLAWAVLALFLVASVPLAWSRGGLPSLVTLSAVDAMPTTSVSTTILPSTLPRQTPTTVETKPATAPTASPVIIPPQAGPVSVIRMAPSAEAKSAIPIATYNKRPLRVARTITMVVTAYCPGKCCCGSHADGITASGKSVKTNGMNLVAADTRLLPFNTVLSIPGYNAGNPVPVLDRGGAIKGNRLDLLMPTHEAAKKWGRKTLRVTVYEYVK